MLKEHNFDSFLKRDWVSFIEINDSPNTSSISLGNWQSCIKGQSFHTHPIKRRKTQNWNLKVKELENTYATNPTEKVCCDSRKYKLELNDLINKKIYFLMERLRHTSFQYNNKLKYLANQIKQNKPHSHLSLLQLNTNDAHLHIPDLRHPFR